MPLQLLPFADSHLDEAAQLLADRHRADRARDPMLPAAFADPAATREVLTAIRAEPGSGVVALQAGRLVGYLLAVYRTPAPTTAQAWLMRPRAAVVRYPCHAADPADAAEIYRALYAALSAQWVAAGYFNHYVTIPATDPGAAEAWASLGFGRDLTYAVRDTRPLAAPAPAPGLTIRLATPADLETLYALTEGLFRHHTAAPVYWPFLPELEGDTRAHNEQAIANPANACWVAYLDGAPVGLQWLEQRTGGGIDVSLPESSIYLNLGYTHPRLRGSGVGTALLARALAWAHEAGYTHCTLHYAAANLLGARFWQRSGFRALSHRLHRAVDERIAWARAPGD
ncbi:MAG TPA: GNAT family N-acetyltransferase [Chloroflexia bacterium]|nr:GNAT family N-acetyltransferase [Chloroflexia bacterium]